MKTITPTLTTREAWALRAVYAITLAVLVIALTNAFEHAKDWHDRHIHSSYWWQGWAFAVIIELPALMGLLLMMVFPKIAPGAKPTIPRALFLGAVAVSIVVQQAYAGSGASWTVRIIVIVPSIFAGIFLEIFFWLLDKVEQFKDGTLFVEATAATPPPPKLIEVQPPEAPARSITDVPGHGHRDTDTDTDKPHPHVPRTERDTSRDITPDMRPGVPETPRVGHADIPQATALVPPPYVPPEEGDTDTDIPAAGRVDISPPAPQDTSRDSADIGGATPDVRPDTEPDVPDADGDTDMDTEPGRDIDPRAVEALSLRRDKKMTNPQIAARFAVSTKTVGRWIKQASEAEPINGKVPELTGTR